MAPQKQNIVQCHIFSNFSDILRNIFAFVVLISIAKQLVCHISGCQLKMFEWVAQVFLLDPGFVYAQYVFTAKFYELERL